MTISQNPGRGRHPLFLVLLAAAGAAAYLPSAGVYFLKDDLSMAIFTDGEGAFHWPGFRDQLLWPTARTWDDIWRPVPALTWAADYLLFGPDPVAFHLGNILFHIGAGVVLYWLLNRWTGFRSPPAVFLGALLFELWPLHPEAILWSTQRTVVLGLLLGFVSLLHLDVWLHRGRRRNLVFAWTAMVLATLSREHGAALPAVMAAMALTLGPPRPARERLKTALQISLTGAVILAAYFGCRWMIFGRLYGGYSGWDTMEGYARALRVAERFPETVLSCLVPANTHYFGGPVLGGGPSWRDLVAGLHAAGAALALFTVLHRLRRTREPLVILSLAVLFAVTAWLPVRQVFWVDPSLLNARSGYHLVALMVAIVPVLMADPYRPGGPKAWRLAAAALLVFVDAIVLQVDLQAYDGGGRQVRGIQEALCREAARDGRDTVHAVFNVPTEFRGCPTMDAYLRWAVRPPYVRTTFDAVPFVVGLDHLWPGVASHEIRLGAPGLAAVRLGGGKNGALRPVSYHLASPGPPYLVPLFGAREAAGGDAPARLLEPEDGEIVLAGARVPIFSFAPGIEGWRGILHLEIPGGRLPLPFETGRNAAKSQDGAIRCRITDSVPAGAPMGLSWPLVSGFPNPFPVQWRVETLDESGTSIGVSASRRLLVLEDRH